MISLLLHMLLNPMTLVGVLAIAVLAAGVYFTAGPVKLLQIAVDIRTWFAIAAVLAVLAFAHQEQVTADLSAKLTQQTQQTTATTDGAKTTQLRVDQKTHRAVQGNRIQQAITTAKPGGAEDAVMDAIAVEQTNFNPEVKNVPSQGVVDRAAVPAGDGLRKRPDGVVVP